MPLELNARAEITLDLYHRVAWRGQGLRLGARAIQRMTERRRQFLDLLDRDPSVTIYGVTTG
jgi:histidine ammonia-lyase